MNALPSPSTRDTSPPPDRERAWRSVIHFPPTRHAFRFPSRWLLIVASFITAAGSPRVARATDADLMMDVEARFKNAIEGSGYKDKMRIDPEKGGSGLDGVFPCKVHRVAIGRLESQIFEWRPNATLNTFLVEMAKSIGRILSAGGLPSNPGFRPLIDLLRDETFGRAVDELKSRYKIKNNRAIIFETSGRPMPCENGIETFVVYIDLKSGNLHAQVEATGCCPVPSSELDVREYRAGFVAEVKIDATGKMQLGRSSLSPYPFGTCCGERSDAYYRALFNGYLGISDADPAPGEEGDDGSPAALECPEIVKLIKEAQREINTLENEMKFLESPTIPERDEIREKIREELGSLRLLRDDLIEEWDRRCDDEFEADAELQAIITISEQEKREREDQEYSPDQYNVESGSVDLSPVGEDLIRVDGRFLDPGVVLDRLLLNPYALSFTTEAVQPVDAATISTDEIEMNPAAESMLRPALTGGTVTLVGFSKSITSGQDTIEFLRDDTLYIVVQHINLDPDADIVDAHLEQDGELRLRGRLHPQADGSFLGAFDLRSLGSGVADVIVTGVAAMPDNSRREVLRHHSSVFITD